MSAEPHIGEGMQLAQPEGMSICWLVERRKNGLFSGFTTVRCLNWKSNESRQKVYSEIYKKRPDAIHISDTWFGDN